MTARVKVDPKEFIRSAARMVVPIVGVDPGPTKSAAVILDSSGRIQDARIISADSMVGWLERISEAIPEALCAIEQITNQGRNAVGGSTFETCYYIGRYTQAFGVSRVQRIPRHDVKKHLLGKVTGNDAQIRAVMLSRYGKEATKRAHVTEHSWQALAVAVVAHDRAWMERRIQERHP